MTRKISHAIVHHSAVVQPDINKLIKSINRTHKERISQPADKNWSTIAYHYIIWVDWETVQTRDIDSIWRHTHRSINWESIGICLSWNFDVNEPTKAQYRSLNNLLASLASIYDGIKVWYHNEYSKKTCPWIYFDKNKVLLINEIDMSLFKKVWLDEVKESERIFTDYKKDDRPITVQDAKYLLDIGISRDNIKDRNFVIKIYKWLLNILKK